MSIENTSTRPGELHLLGALSEGTDSYIGGMEKAGEAQLVASAVIPTERSVPDAELTDLGFVLGALVEGDPLFQNCTVPDGWTKRPTDHDMWSEILDNEERVRFRIFYKAAFYDRRAAMDRAR
jgi:hypothetical protein